MSEVKSFQLRYPTALNDSEHVQLGYVRRTFGCEAGRCGVVEWRCGAAWHRDYGYPQGLSFETTIESDCAPLCEPVSALPEAGIEIHCLRDLTRGGLSSGLIEIAETGRARISIEELSIPVRKDVAGACRILGLDPLYLANEGRFVALVPEPETA